ncbi:MAG TPA: N-acetyltransferase [Kofleriaceae bacterium]|nr:N-acetyltransferase [Kofleriaceae bacterium]
MTAGELRVRDATADDVGFLWLMLTYAASMTPPPQPSAARPLLTGDRTSPASGEADRSIERVTAAVTRSQAVAEAMTDAYLRTYVDAWGLPGDLGVIAERGGAPVGAAWVRLVAGKRGPDPADAAVPELATATLPSDRGGGAGTAMLRRLIDRARGAYPAIVLSVRDGNPAVRLYERAGFRTERTIENRVGGVSFVMRLDLGGAVTPPAG